MADKKKKARKNKRGGCVSGGSIRPAQEGGYPKKGVNSGGGSTRPREGGYPKESINSGGGSDYKGPYEERP